MSEEIRDISQEMSLALVELRGMLLHEKVNSVMRALYPDLFTSVSVSKEPENNLSELIGKIDYLVPAEQNSAVRLADQVAMDSLEKVLILQLAASKTMTDCRWLHYSLAVHLGKLGDQGCEQAMLPALLHRVAALIFSPDDTPGQAYINRSMAECSERYAPRASLYWAGQALRKGEDAAMGPIMRIGKRLVPALQTQSETTSKEEALQYIAAYFGWQKAEFSVRDSMKEGLLKKEITPATSVDIAPPKGDKFYYAFGTLETPSERPSISVFNLENGFLSVDLTKRGTTEFYVFDQNRICYSDLSRGDKPFIEANIDKFDGELASLGDKFCGPMNVCHFLLDHLTRVKIFEMAGAGSVNYLLWEEYDRYTEILRSAQFLDRTKVQTKRKFTVQARNLLISSNATYNFRHPAHISAPWAISFLKSLFGYPSERPSRKIFISRADSRSRLIKNFDEVQSVLLKHRFETVTLSDKTFGEQRRIFGEAEQVVGVHGAGLTNMLFSPTGLKVLEILPPISATQAYWVLARGCGHSYRAFVSEDPEYNAAECAAARGRPGMHGRDIVVDPIKLDVALGALNSDIAI